MHKSVPLLVCGNAGGVGGELLRRRDIQTYWALTPEEAVAVLEKVRPKIALAREEHALEIMEAARKVRTPVIVLLDDGGWERREPYFLAGATALVHATASARILEAVSELTDLAFAKHPRVLYSTAVEVEIAGQARLLETVNLSASGMCVAGIDPLEQGLGAKVSFPLMDPPIALEALVIRTFHDGRRDLGGLAFVHPKPDVEARLRALVDAEIARDEDAAFTVEVPIIDDPIAEALESLSMSGDAAVSALKDKLRDIHLASKKDQSLGRAKPRAGSTTSTALERTLSPSERAHVLGEPVADWVKPALDTRLKLHVERSSTGAPSSRTVQDALSLCRTLGRGAGDATSMTEVCAVRASLLRDVYAEPPRTRHGAAAPAGAGLAVALPAAPPRAHAKGKAKSVRA